MDVCVFGAGASAPYGAPTMSELLPRAFAPRSLTSSNRTNVDDELEILATAIDNEYGTDLARTLAGRGHPSPQAAVCLRKINVEHLLALTDERGDITLRTAIERVIFKTIEESYVSGGRTGEYEKLIEHATMSGRRTCFISLNYDLLLDRALVDAAHSKPTRWSYGIPFSAGIERFPSYRDDSDPYIYLLKLHGSLNWAQCASCGNLRLYFFASYDQIPRVHWPLCATCSRDFATFRPVLVAPGPLKRWPEGLQMAWELASKCLQRAESLTVIGYSFSPYDRNVRDLFLRSFVISNLYSQRRPRLTIVNSDSCTCRAIEAWFTPAVDSSIAPYPSFEEYVRAICRPSVANGSTAGAGGR